MIGSRAAIVLCAALSLPSGARGNEPKAVLPDPQFDFGHVLRGSLVEHEFILKNDGSAALRTIKVTMTAPLVVTRMPREVEPGGEGLVHFSLNTAGLTGPFRGHITVFLNDPEQPEVDLTFEGVVTPPVEVLPLPAFFVAGVRGKATSASVEIINHEPAPLRILTVAHPRERFTTSVETVEPGRRFKLTLTLKPDGPGGRNTETIVVATSSDAQPTLEISANSYLHERIYTFPDAVDLGAIPISQIRKDPGLLRALAQTLMVYQDAGSDFRATLRTDLRGLNLVWERGPKGDRYQATVSLDPSSVSVGPYNGLLFIDTNDPALPILRVPVSGRILDQRLVVAAQAVNTAGPELRRAAMMLMCPTSTLCYRPATRLGTAGSHPGVPSSHWLSVSCSTWVPS